MPYCAGYYTKSSTFSRTKRLTATQPETGHELAWTWPCHRERLVRPKGHQRWERASQSFISAYLRTKFFLALKLHIVLQSIVVFGLKGYF